MKFWMVFKVGGGAPSFQHQSLELALEEAHRLAHAKVPSQCYILEAVKVVEPKYECIVSDLEQAEVTQAV